MLGVKGGVIPRLLFENVKWNECWSEDGANKSHIFMHAAILKYEGRQILQST